MKGDGCRLKGDGCRLNGDVCRLKGDGCRFKGDVYRFRGDDKSFLTQSTTEMVCNRILSLLKRGNISFKESLSLLRVIVFFQRTLT